MYLNIPLIRLRAIIWGKKSLKQFEIRWDRQYCKNNNIVVVQPRVFLEVSTHEQNHYFGNFHRLEHTGFF